MDTANRLQIIERQDQCRVLERVEPYRSAWIALRETASELSSIDVPWALAHGDFKIDNLMVVGTDLVGVDAALRHTIPVYYDLTNFNSNLMTNLAKSLSPALRWRTRRFRTAFLESYERTSGWALSPTVLAWCSLGAALTHAGNNEVAGAGKLPKALNAIMTRRRLRALRRARTAKTR
jgi:hypothetical protein